MPIKLLIKGIVQGVGFRPSVYQIATKNNWRGWVLNCGYGVEVVLENDTSEKLIHDLKLILPPVSSIDSVNKEKFQTILPNKFEIRESDNFLNSNTKIPTDQKICNTCTQELFDPKSKYYLYPFISCTACGPRYSIIENLPYDRKHTSMSDFHLCQSCLNTYSNPLDRRYHAEATACVKCGPELSTKMKKIITAIQKNKIVALKGIGGYTLVTNAKDIISVTNLRKRKKRPRKPFAIMALNIASITKQACLDDSSIKALESGSAPIVLCERKSQSSFPNISNGFPKLGFMLPQTPLHLLLFYHLLNCPSGDDWLTTVNDIFLVVTSGNYSGGTIISDQHEADKVLSNIADLVVHDNRRVIAKVDDSVLISNNQQITPIRKSKGFAPFNMNIGKSLPNTLALGTNLKNTITYIKGFGHGSELTASQHIGDMQSEYSIKNFHQILYHFKQIFCIKPEIVTSDFHLDGYVRQYAETLGIPFYPVYHHHAHAAAVMAEYQLEEECIALILDGYGYGIDAEPWGGELLKCSNTNFERIGHLQELALPGGDKAAQEPWRMALALAYELKLKTPQHIKIQNNSKQLQDLISQNFFVKTSSMGRLFDAVSSYLDICNIASFEGEPAMLLEGMANKLSWEKIQQNFMQFNAKKEIIFKSTFLLDSWLSDILNDPDLNSKSKAIAFHEVLIAKISVWVLHATHKFKLKSIILSGGCFQNKHLSYYISQLLSENGCKVYMPDKLPVNDASISIGQAWVAAHQHLKGKNMCLAIPTLIVELVPDNRAIAEVSGIRKEISLALVEDVNVGDYVIVHVGFALNKLDQEDAQETLKLFQELLRQGDKT